ncbi:MAG TPA: sensor histidine kinase [Acidimicrobiales bacterium]
MLRDLLRPWRRRQTWWDLVHLVLDVFVGAATFTAVVTVGFVSGIMLLVPFLWPLAAVGFWFLFALGRLIGWSERSRFRSLLGLDLADPVPPLQGSNPWRRFLERFRDWARWRELVHGLVLLPVGLFTSLLTLAAWCVPVALIGLPLYVDELPGDEARFGLFSIGTEQQPGVWLLAVAGVVGLVFLAPWITVGLARADAWIARHLLSRPESELVKARLGELEVSRSAAVDSAEAERRRIERDLHDGAQQRLVALAMGLGAARERLESDPERGRQLVAEAHEEAKAALKDLRDLVRGIHPVILEDRGLDPALSAVVARSPVPVTLNIEIDERPPPAIESTAYFVVSEALTNVARHAEANRAEVSIVRAGDRLVIEVRDDGRGGADASKGSGLTGLRNRVAGHGGTLDVISPEGGPTTLLVELPCGS